MDIRELQLFLKLAETLHYTRTSHLMAISPSALSRTIQRMEDQVGQRLFFRDNRGVILTPAGQRFREYARDVLDQWLSLQNDLSGDENELRGELTLYSSVTGCYTILPDLLSLCRRQFPGIHIKLKTGSAADAVAAVVNGYSDLSVAAEPDVLSENLIFLNVTETPLQLVVPSMDCDINTKISANDKPWYELPLILPEKGLARKRIDRFFRSHHIHPEIYAEADGNEGIMALVSLGFGVGIVPSLVRETSPMRDSIRVLEEVEELAPYKVGLCVNRRNSQTPVVRAFTSLVESSQGDME